MTPQERELLTNLVTRLRQAPAQDRDTEAESMINDLVGDKPDTPYVLAQTVLIQDYALHQAQARIVELERQAKGQDHHDGGFLSSIFGSSKPARPQAQAQPGYPLQPAYPPQPAYQAQPAYAAPPAAGPWGQPTAGAPQYFAQTQGQPSFLRSAATTAAGVAGGALLFQGIESLLGGHGGGLGYGGLGGAGFGGFGPQPGITETVVNNYYESSPPDAPQADFQQGGNDSATYDQGSDFSDASFDRGDDFSDDDGGFTDV